MIRKFHVMAALALILSLALPTEIAPQTARAAEIVNFTILHTNDFHGQLEQYSGGNTSNPGIARLAQVVKDVRAAVPNVLLLDAGDEMQGSLLSNIYNGEPTIAAFNQLGYAAATFGNHEFDWGQTTLIERVTQAAYPFVAANIVSGACSDANWMLPSFVQPYVVKTLGTAPNQVRVGIIGVTSTETPYITIPEATAGLCFKDPLASIVHYYDEVKAASDVIVVLSHLGYADGGYGYGLTVYGDQTLAKNLNTAGKPVNLIIGGHSHTNLSAATMVGNTAVVQAYYNGRKVGRADMSFNPDTKAVTFAWQSLSVPPAGTPDPEMEALVSAYASDPDYLELINQEVGWTNVPITRDYNGDSLMGYFVNDAVYNDLNTDADLANDVEIVFNNPGGLRADITCAAYPCMINYGMIYNVLPFGNQTIVGNITGAKILELLNQSALLTKGAIQVAGMRYKFYNYKKVDPLAPPATPPTKRSYAWGAFDACVVDKTTQVCEPLDLNRTYRIATNEFLAPAGQDNFYAFKYVTGIAYFGDMLLGVNRWVSANYTETNPYNGALDGRITRDGNDDSGSIIPITILHHNDSHGNLVKGAYVGYPQLATLIKQERYYNPTRTLLLSGGDNIQGDAMMYYFKSAALGYAADGTPLEPPLTTHPMMAVMNAMGYDAWTLGNHEYNFGSQIFTSVVGQAQFPTLQANVADDGQYGLGEIPVLPYIEKDIEGIKLAIMGIGNHRVPNYELPSNIPGLTFSDPLVKAQELANQLGPTNDVVVALTHIGFTENPSSVEVDANVDTNMAATVSGLDVIIGAHSHTNPATGFGDYKYLPTFVTGPDGTPVLINQAYRYNNTLGEIILGVRPKAGGGYELVTRAGQYLSVPMTTVEDAQIKAIVDPYVTALNAYNNTVIGQTTEPIDALQAFTQETNAANLQADSSVYELAKNDITVDFHLSGAMTNRKVADAATPASPVTLKVADMFTLMPYENSLVVMEMNGPQLKAVLERAYRNYYYYKYVAGYGGYSYYTTCMLDVNDVGKIMYRDTSPALPDGNNVQALVINGQAIDFSDAATYYRVSTVNYLAAGSCNFNDGGVSLWPLNQIVNDTQYYVRDAVIDYITYKGIVSPKIEGRLVFNDTSGPLITINAPLAMDYEHPELLTLDFEASDTPSGVALVEAWLDGVAVVDGQVIDLLTLDLGEHELAVHAADWYGNEANASVTFFVVATPQSLLDLLDRLYSEGKIDDSGIYNSLYSKLQNYLKALEFGRLKAANNVLAAFIHALMAQSGVHITQDAVDLLIADALWVMDHPQTVVAYRSLLGLTGPYDLMEVYLTILQK